ncbi:hypothetical protein GUJ93_ZPchr0007g3499 [Zizania palustris]|uniref:Uncharacterized protein n=1 Tax=Zizania palustris TaxID=103762 RepID=A0A8J5SQB1_ZIZPA|nr:hypothetical protein GUJ93_ZPchr0007g3499 [Zizania palustris]
MDEDVMRRWKRNPARLIRLWCLTERLVRSLKELLLWLVRFPGRAVAGVGFLPHGIVEPYSDMELKPLWLTRRRNHRYLNIVKSEGLEISQPEELIEEIKIAQEKDHLFWGDRTKNIGVVDSEYLVHRGVQTLGGSSVKLSNGKNIDPLRPKTAQAQQQTRVRRAGLDMRTKIRRNSRLELGDFQKRWERAAREDRAWVDPFARSRRKRKNNDQQHIGRMFRL